MTIKNSTIFNFRNLGPTVFKVNTSNKQIILPPEAQGLTLTAEEKKSIYNQAGLTDTGGTPAASSNNAQQNNRAATTPGSESTPAQPTPSPLNPVGIEDRLKLKNPLSYPSDLSSQQTYIQFTSYDYSTVSRTTTDIFNVANNAFVKALSGEAVKVKAFSSDIINLYVPPGITVRYGADWGTGSLGATGASYLRGGQGIQGVLDTAGNLVTSAIQTGTQLGADQLASALSSVPNFSATGQQLIGLTTGLIFNSNEFSTFSKIPMRDFTYSFLMVARSKPESVTINQIINCFKLGMMPFSKTGIQNDITGSTGTAQNQARPAILKYPKLWLIKYKVGDNTDNPYLPISKFCALTNLSVNYTPNSVFTTLTDNSIPAIQIDLSFKELTPLVGDEILSPGTLNAPGVQLGEGLESPQFSENAIDSSYNIKGATF